MGNPRSRRKLLLVAALVGMGAAACEGSNGQDGKAGAEGAQGKNALTKVTPEPAGTHCAAGGTKVEVGLDANNDGVLDPSEVNAAATTYVCNGSGKNAVVKTSPEAAGTNCASGGVKVESGIDADGNGVLDPSEVIAAQTTYVCNAPGNTGITSPSTGITISVKSVSTKATDPIAVRFTLKDDRGFPIDLAGKFSVNTPVAPRFAIGTFTKDASGNVSPLTVLTKSGATPQPTAYSPTGTTPGHGAVVENGFGAGDYTYTFPSTTTKDGAVAVAYDATKLNETHVVWIQATRQTDPVFTDNAKTFYAANQDYYFVPSGTGTPLTREIAATTGCNKCHDRFKPESTASGEFHGGGRISAPFCAVCHNPGRTSNPAADASVFVHRIHRGQHLQPANLFHKIAATYPQDIRNCDACHKGAAQGAQAQTRPTLAACGSCHDYVDFTGKAATSCTDPVTLDAKGLPVPCKHVGGVQADNATCSGCHTASNVAAKHLPVAPPDPKNAWLVTGGNNNTNASYLAAAGVVPKGAAVITYDLKSVEAVDDAAITPAKRPQITFKLKKNGADVVFQTYAAGTTTEIMPGFVGSPSVYFAFAVPQDGIKTPTDFNASVSGYIKNIWNGTATTTGAGTLTGPDASGYYTIKLTGVQIPPTAIMLTGGVGYTYSLASAPPLTQIDLPEYPYNTDGKKQGGLSVPAPNVWKVATSYTARRPIVDNARCNNCHGFLGVAPTFHAGQRNDGPTCSFCHTPNRASSGWSAGSKYFVHGIHAGRKREQPFVWHATEAGPGFGEVEFPAPLNDCRGCHLPNTYDFTAATSSAAVPNMALTTVATGKYNSDPAANPTGYYSLSPYVVADNVKDYGTGFSFASATGTSTEAAASTLIISPVTTACIACHDSGPAIDHMRANGGRFYSPRSEALAAGASKEQCLMCHGPGRVAAVGVVHF